MNLSHKIVKHALLVLATGVAIFSCQKMERPSLTDYPPDTNPPGGPLKFYAALDDRSVDSIRAVFGVDKDATFVEGVSGTAVQADASKKGYVAFPSTNDFGSATNFSMAFWMKATLAQKNRENAAGILAFANSKNFWGNATFFAESDKSASDSMILKIHFNAAGNKDNWQAQYTGSKQWPKMYDGNWHHVAVTYSAADSVYTAYRDGVQFDRMTMSPAIKFENASQLIISGYQEAVGIVDTYANNTWMAAFAGTIDQVRLYGTTLSAAEVSTLYTEKK